MKPKKFITKKNLNSAQKLKKEYSEWEVVDNLITREFGELKNSNLGDLFVKIQLIDNFYNCNLRNQGIAYRELSILFFENNINELLNSKSNDAVKIIDEVIYKKYGSHSLVFVSKFCYFTHPDKYPIIDGFARRALSDITGIFISYYEKDYNLFKKDVDDLIEFLNKELKLSLDYRIVDVYLWCYGQYLRYLKLGDNDFSLFTIKLFIDKKDLFQNLIPKEI